ncbi:MAG: ATP-binding protein [Culicoidibacterales bacterium]
MDINFKSITYSNIMSVGASPITVELDTCVKTLITGTNGAGKSTMIEALCFLLYGKPFRNITKAQLINAVNKKALLVEGTFTVGNNEFYIKRGIKPNILEIHKNGEQIPEMASVTEFQNYFETDLLGISLESFKQIIVLGTAGYIPFMELSTPKRRDLVEDLLDVAILGEMESLNKAHVKELTANMNAITSSTESKEREKATVQRGIDAQQAQTESLIETQSGQLRSLVAGIRDLNNDAATAASASMNLIEPSEDDLNVKIEDLKIEFNKIDYQEQIDAVIVPDDADLKAELETVAVPVKPIIDVEKLKLDESKSYEKSIADLPMIADLPDDVPPYVVGYSDVLDTAEIVSQITEIKFDIKNYKSILKFHETGGDCPTCGSSADSCDNTDDYKTLLQTRETKLAVLEAQLENVVKTHTEKTAEESKRYGEYLITEKAYQEAVQKHRLDSIQRENDLASIKREYERVIDKIDADAKSVEHDYALRLNTYTARIDAIKAAHNQKIVEQNALIASLKAEMQSAGSVLESKILALRTEFDAKVVEVEAMRTRLNDKVTMIKAQVDEETKRAKDLKAAIDKLRETSYDTSELDKLTDEINELKLKKSELFEQNYCRGIISSMLKDNGIKASIVKKYIPVFNKKINEYLHRLNADYSFHLNESFEETIKSRGRESFAYASFSEGEKTRINLALLFTWRDVASMISGVNINLLILDEVADGSSDADGVAAINKILDNLNSNVFVISHRTENVDDSFQRHIKMKKQGRYTVREQ